MTSWMERYKNRYSPTWGTYILRAWDPMFPPKNLPERARALRGRLRGSTELWVSRRKIREGVKRPRYPVRPLRFQSRVWLA